MQRLSIAALAFVLLGGCASIVDEAYDDHARSECEREASPRERGGCLDRVEQNRRAR